jgi:site-specific recombinase XerD
LDLRHDQVTIHGKGDRVRVIPFGAKTGQAIDRYLRQRVKHRDVKLPALWLGARGMGLTPSGLTQMLRRRAGQAGVGHVHPHQLRHTAAHVWADSGGSEADAMVLFGWRSPEMPRRYGRSAATERAQRAARRISPADRF